MADKLVKTRVQMKRGSQSDWITAEANGFLPLEGEYIFYTDLNKTKVGKKDASGNLIPLSQLDFLNANDADTLDGKHASDFALKSSVPTSFAPVDAEKNVQSDWTVTDSTSDAFIKNKPTIPTKSSWNYDDAYVKYSATQSLTDAQKSTARTNIGAGTSNFSGNYNDLTNKPTIPTDTNQTVKTGSVTFGANDVVEFVAGSNVSISGDAANKKITISSTDTNTETTLTVTDKSNTDTTDLVYAVTNIVEGGTKGHALTTTYTGLPTKAYVDKAVLNGGVNYLGTVSAITGLSTTADAGDFYRASTAFAFGSETAHIGDILIATKANPAQNTTDWDLLHTEVDSVYTHPSSGVTAGTYRTVTVNAQGHVTGGSNPTTLSGHGITDAYTKTEVESKINTLISHGTSDPTSETTSQYYFKYN